MGTKSSDAANSSLVAVSCVVDIFCVCFVFWAIFVQWKGRLELFLLNERDVFVASYQWREVVSWERLSHPQSKRFVYFSHVRSLAGTFDGKWTNQWLLYVIDIVLYIYSLGPFRARWASVNFIKTEGKKRSCDAEVAVLKRSIYYIISLTGRENSLMGRNVICVVLEENGVCIG